MVIKEWGFVLKPVGGIGAASRAIILIGYPFLFAAPPIPPVPPTPAAYVDPNLNYYRQYMLDLRAIPSSPLVTINLTSVDMSPDLSYFRKYLGERI